MQHDIQSGQLKALQIMHRAMLTGQVVFAAIALYLDYSGSFLAGLKSYDHPLQVIAIIFSFAGFFTGSVIFKKKIQQSKESLQDLKTKLAVYRSAALIQWALLEGPVLFSIICFMLTSNYAFLALAVVFILLFIVTGPNKTKMVLMLQLSEEEAGQL